MRKKSRELIFVFLFIILLIVLSILMLIISGSFNNKSLQKTNNQEENASKQKILSDLMRSLKAEVSDYSGNYYEEVHWSRWPGHSGAGGGHDGKNVKINFLHNRMIYYNEEVDIGIGYNNKESYTLEYDPSQNITCKKNYIKYYNFNSSYAYEEQVKDTCYEEVQESLDLSTKEEIIELIENAEMKSFTIQKNTEKGTCYSGFYMDFAQTFCFNENNLLTYAYFGWKKDEYNFYIKTLTKEGIQSFG